jgi:hypothetical protein
MKHELQVKFSPPSISRKHKNVEENFLLVKAKLEMGEDGKIISSLIFLSNNFYLVTSSCKSERDAEK